MGTSIYNLTGWYLILKMKRIKRTLKIDIILFFIKTFGNSSYHGGPHNSGVQPYSLDQISMAAADEGRGNYNHFCRDDTAIKSLVIVILFLQCNVLLFLL